MFPLPEGQEALAGATIVTPLETLLTQQLTISIDDGLSKRYPFTWCGILGCVARVGFTADEVAMLRNGSVAHVVIVPMAAPDQQVIANVSLAGFTAAYEAVEATMAN
jgi:invasion protein IalB